MLDSTGGKREKHYDTSLLGPTSLVIIVFTFQTFALMANDQVRAKQR